MADAAGWIVAALVAVVAILSRLLTKARQMAAKRVVTPVDVQPIREAQQTIKNATKAEIDGLWDKLDGDDDADDIASAANEARDNR